MSPAAARLDVVAGKAAGMSIVVEDELFIGRHSDGAGRLADDDEISRSHARLSLDGAGFCAIEDLGSTNGTFVNGLRISSPQTLSEGDSIEVGGTTLVVRDLPENAHRGVPPQPTLIPGEVLQRAVSDLTPVPAEVAPERGPGEDKDQTRVASRARLSLQLDVDLATGEATLALGRDSEPVRLVLRDGAWHPERPG